MKYRILQDQYTQRFFIQEKTWFGWYTWEAYDYTPKTYYLIEDAEDDIKRAVARNRKPVLKLVKEYIFK